LGQLVEPLPVLLVGRGACVGLFGDMEQQLELADRSVDIGHFLAMGRQFLTRTLFVPQRRGGDLFSQRIERGAFRDGYVKPGGDVRGNRAMRLHRQTPLQPEHGPARLPPGCAAH